jgi:predicted nucleic acid-binding protein
LNRFVLDASVGLAWFIDKPQPRYAAEIRARLSAGARAAVPSLWHLEMGNGFALAQRRGAFSPVETDQYLFEIESLLATCIETEAELLPIGEVVRSAISLQLSAYDALYLKLAQSLGLPLATLDRELQRAAAKAGVPLVS